MIGSATMSSGQAEAIDQGRRRSLRWPVDFPVGFGVDSQQASGVAVDICEEGIGFRSEVTWPIGSEIYINLQGPELTNAARRIKGRVCHHTAGVTGVAFLELPEVEKLRILEIIYLGIALRRR